MWAALIEHVRAAEDRAGLVAAIIGVLVTITFCLIMLVVMINWLLPY